MKQLPFFLIRRVFDIDTDREHRYLGRDNEGWHVTSDILAYAFKTHDAAQRVIDKLVFHCHARECLKIIKMRRFKNMDFAKRDVLFNENPDQRRGCA